MRLSILFFFLVQFSSCNFQTGISRFELRQNENKQAQFTVKLNKQNTSDQIALGNIQTPESVTIQKLIVQRYSTQFLIILYYEYSLTNQGCSQNSMYSISWLSANKGEIFLFHNVFISSNFSQSSSITTKKQLGTQIVEANYKLLVLLEVLPCSSQRLSSINISGVLQSGGKQYSITTAGNLSAIINHPSLSVIIRKKTIVWPNSDLSLWEVSFSSAANQNKDLVSVTFNLANYCKTNCLFGFSWFAQKDRFYLTNSLNICIIVLKKNSITLFNMIYLHHNQKQIKSNLNWECQKCGNYCNKCQIKQSELGLCTQCNFQCKNCINKSICLKCNNGYILIGTQCQILLENLTFSISQQINKISIFCFLKFKIPLNNQLKVTFKNNSIKSNLTYSNNQIKISFELQNPTPSVLMQVDRKDLEVFNSTLPNNFLFIDLKDIHLFSQKQKIILEVTGFSAQTATEIAKYGRLVFIMLGSLYIMSNLIEFVSTIAFYLFMMIKIPANLQFILYVIDSTFQAEIIPVRISSPFSSYDSSFVKPATFRQQNMSLNFISSNVFTISQLLGLLSIFFLLEKFVNKFKKSNWISNFFISQFKNLYKNCAQAILSCQIPLSFACATALLDLKINMYYKAINFGISIFCLFIFTFLPLLHPIYLYVVKKNKKIDTNQCYARTLRNKKWSEFYLFCKYFSGSVTAVAIPLAPPLVTLSLMVLNSFLQVFSAYKATFNSTSIKVSRICFLITHAFLHIALLNIFIVDKYLQNYEVWMLLGYLAIGLICLNILHELVIIIYELAVILKDFFKRMINQKDNKQKRKKIIKQRNHLVQRKKYKEEPKVIINQESSVTIKKTVKSRMCKIKKVVIKFTKETQIFPKENLRIQIEHRKTNHT